MHFASSPPGKSILDTSQWWVRRMCEDLYFTVPLLIIINMEKNHSTYQIFVGILIFPGKCAFLINPRHVQRGVNALLNLQSNFSRSYVAGYSPGLRKIYVKATNK